MPTLHRTQISLEPKLHAILRRKAADQGISLAELIRRELWKAHGPAKGGARPRLRDLAGIFKGDDAASARDHDRYIYDDDDQRQDQRR